ncbi:MAG: quaternary amine ABC transporter ATP-binding protein [Arenicella sp.]
MTEIDKPVIECQNIWKIFGEQAVTAMKAVQQNSLSKLEVQQQFDCVVGVSDASFSVSRGEIFCIMGLSGSGKSTLIRHINRLIEPTFGKILIDGKSVGDLNSRELRELRASKIGMVFQNMALMPHRTVLDNVAFSLEVRGISKKERYAVAQKALTEVDLQGWETKYPDELSGGMQQRVGLARAIVADPDILLMDEPFSALDPLIRKQLQDQFMELASKMKKTTLFITHDLDEAIRIGDRIAIMKDGELVQIGTPEEIVTQPVDDYVADFVAGISNLNLVTAARVMKSVDAYQSENPSFDIANCLTASHDDSLSALVDISLESDQPIAIQQNNDVVGVVTKRSLLRGIQGQWQE